MYKCVNVLFENLNSSIYFSHPTITYNCEMTIVLRMCDNMI